MLARLQRQQRRQVVNGHNIQRRACCGRDPVQRLVKGGVDVAKRQRVVRVAGVAAHVDQDFELPRIVVEHFFGQERWDWFGEVDAVDENVVLHQRRERALLHSRRRAGRQAGAE